MYELNELNLKCKNKPKMFAKRKGRVHEERERECGLLNRSVEDVENEYFEYVG